MAFQYGIMTILIILKQSRIVLIVEYAPCTSPIMHFICPPTFITFVFHFSRVYTGKNNIFPFLDILGYLKNTHKNPSQRTWLGIPWLGRVSLCQIWDFYGYSLNTLKFSHSTCQAVNLLLRCLKLKRQKNKRRRRHQLSQ